MDRMITQFYDDSLPKEPTFPEILVFPQAITIEAYKTAVEAYKPFAAIPPWKLTDTGWTSRAWDKASKVTANTRTGVVVVGESDSTRIEFFIWAQSRNAGPIVLLPHDRKTRSRQVMELVLPGYVQPTTWVHLPYPNTIGALNPENMPGQYTTGEWQ